MAKQFSRIYSCKILSIGPTIEGDRPDGKHYAFNRLCLEYDDYKDHSMRVCEVLCNADIIQKYGLETGIYYDFRLTFENYAVTRGYLC